MMSSRWWAKRPPPPLWLTWREFSPLQVNRGDGEGMNEGVVDDRSQFVLFSLSVLCSICSSYFCAFFIFIYFIFWVHFFFPFPPPISFFSVLSLSFFFFEVFVTNTAGVGFHLCPSPPSSPVQQTTENETATDRVYVWLGPDRINIVKNAHNTLHTPTTFLADAVHPSSRCSGCDFWDTTAEKSRILWQEWDLPEDSPLPFDRISKLCTLELTTGEVRTPQMLCRILRQQPLYSLFNGQRINETAGRLNNMYYRNNERQFY